MAWSLSPSFGVLLSVLTEPEHPNFITRVTEASLGSSGYINPPCLESKLHSRKTYMTIFRHSGHSMISEAEVVIALRLSVHIVIEKLLDRCYGSPRLLEGSSVKSKRAREFDD